MYFTPEEMRTRLGDDAHLYLVDSDSDDQIGEKDLERLTEAIREASSEMDSYVARRYPVPLESKHVTPVLIMHVRNMVIYHLSPDGAEMSSTIEKKYLAACRWGEQVSCGKVRLGDTDNEPETRLPAAKASTDTARRRSGRTTTRIVSRTTMRKLV